MPDLSRLATNNIELLQTSRAIGIDPYEHRHPEAAYITGLVRFTDKATRDYEEARTLLGYYVHSRGRSARPLFLGLDALGDCVIATHVAIEFAASLRKHGIGQNRYLPDKQTRTAIRFMRNHVLHAFDKLARPAGAADQIRPQDANAPWPEERQIVFGQHVLRYADLASAIRRSQRQAAVVIKTRARARRS
jgi:hypothetical protein